MVTPTFKNRTACSSICLVLLWLAPGIYGLVKDGGIDRATLRRWVGGLDLDLEQRLSSGRPFLRAPGATIEEAQEEDYLVERASKAFASDEGRLHLKELKASDAGFDSFDEEERRTKQTDLCNIAASDFSMVSSTTAQCLCGNDEVFVHCEALLEQEAQEFLDSTDPQLHSSSATVQNPNAAERATVPAKCEVTSCNFLGMECDTLKNPNSFDLEDFYGFLNDLSDYAFLEGSAAMECSLKLPKIPFEVNIGVRLNGRVLDIDDENLHAHASDTSAGVSGELCWLGANEDFAGPLFDVLDFFGVNRCFLTMNADLFPLLGTLEASLEASYSFMTANMDLIWMFEDNYRNEFQLCSGASCSKTNNLHCSMCPGQVFVSGKLTLRLLFWDVSFIPLDLFPAVDGCATYEEDGTCISGLGEPDCWEDGTVCLPGTSCNSCCNIAYDAGGFKCGGEAWADGTACFALTSCQLCANGYSWWLGAGYRACGEEPCWSDGTLCIPGTTCNSCCKTAYNAGGTKCGGKAWSDGTACLAGTSCKSCANGSSWWIGAGYQACGQEPCWKDGTRCLAGTTCGECCNRAYNAGGTKCGGRAWSDGTACLAGTSCKLCANGNSWWLGAGYQACGREPCWKKDTVCGLGTTCNSCCRGANCPWYWFGVCKCK